MEIRKIIFAVFFVAISFNAIAQKHPVFYGGMDLYRQGSFENNYFGSLNVGAQIYQFNFFAPEIGYDAFYGGLPDMVITSGNENPGLPDAVFQQWFRTSVLTLNPKLKFGKDDAFLVISPKYHIGNARARASYDTNELNNGTYTRKKYQEIKSQISYWSFAVGFEGVYISPHFWLGMTLNFTNLNISENWSALDFSEYDVKADNPGTTSLGFGFRIYYDPFASEND